MTKNITVPYEYHNLPIPGGGYVTGFVFHPKKANILYARTDIGGTYRYNYEKRTWKSLIDHVTMSDLSESYPSAIALDESHPERLYIVCGCSNKEHGLFAVSEDYGDTFRYYPMPCKVHGNYPGRGTGQRLVVDPSDDQILYFASQTGGLYRTMNGGKEWTTIDIGNEADERKDEHNLTMVWLDPESVCSGRAQTIVVGTAGVDNKTDEMMRGHSLYVSYDGGTCFTPLQEPESIRIKESQLSGLVAQRYAYDGTYLYVTFASTGRYAYFLNESYSCDSGDSLDGRVVRYNLDEERKISECVDITPSWAEKGLDHNKQFYDFGFGGISTSVALNGLVVCTTICREQGDIVFRSFDYGETWEPILCDLEVGSLTYRTPYMKPEYNGGHSIIHWMSDIKINPFDLSQAVVNTGTGVFSTETLTEPCVNWHDLCKGIEETVHLNVYSPPSGKVKLIDILGDLGGFAFTDLTSPCENSFADEEGNRYITCINADYRDLCPEHLIVTPRGNWKGKTTGGLIVSHDQGQTFEHLELPYGVSDYVDTLLERISCPNVNSGWVALSADGTTIVWSVADGVKLPMNAVLVSKNEGKNYQLCQFFDLKGCLIETDCIKIFSDRVYSCYFYGFSNTGHFYVSHDGGVCFYEQDVPELPQISYSKIDTNNKVEIRGEAGMTGVFWMACGSLGLYRLQADHNSHTCSVKKLSQEGDFIYRVGLGIGRTGDYFSDTKTIYCNGIIGGVYGFYRSEDEAITWSRINTEQQMYGDILSIDGDSREFGRFFLATGSRGVLYGEPIKNN